MAICHLDLRESARKTEMLTWPRGVTVSTLDSESSDRGSNPREAFAHQHVNMKKLLSSCAHFHRKGMTSNALGTNVGVAHLATRRCTVAILAQGTSWAVAVTQAFWAAVRIPRAER